MSVCDVLDGADVQESGLLFSSLSADVSKVLGTAVLEDAVDLVVATDNFDVVDLTLSSFFSFFKFFSSTKRCKARSAGSLTS